MKLPGDSDNMDKGVSHEMMQRSLQSQRRVVKRVGLLEDKVGQLENVEDRVDDLENTEIEPDTRLGDLAYGSKKIAKGIGKSIGKNASLLADKAGKGLSRLGKVLRLQRVKVLKMQKMLLVKVSRKVSKGQQMQLVKESRTLRRKQAKV